MREHGCRHVMSDRFLDRPASLTGIGDPALDVREIWPFLFARTLCQLEEPGPDDAPLHPNAGDAFHVDLEFARVDQLEALAVGLHHPVLDPVVDHLDKVPRAALAEVRPPVRWRERVESWLHVVDRARLAADHHAVADLEAPDAARDADVE